MLDLVFPYEYADGVFDIDYDKLYRKGIRGLVFDIDNTLVHHGDDSTPEVDALFVKLHDMGFKTLLLSNNDKARVERFIKNIDTDYICDADKPHKKCYLNAVRKLAMPREKVVFIGDQIFTDILGANRSGMQGILVKYILLPGETKLGKRRYAEMALLWLWRHTKKYQRFGGISIKENNREKSLFEKIRLFLRGELLFCDINEFCYDISATKQILRRNISDMRSSERFAWSKRRKRLPCVVSEHHSHLIKRGKGVDPVLQENKAVNIKIAGRKMNGIMIRPGETFSFWRTVGSITKKKGYKDGRIISANKLTPGLGGGLCNLGNTIHLLVLHSPLEVTEFHSHSDALAPDEGKRVPFSSGTSVCYNYIDYRFKNTTDQNFQLLIWCKDEELYGELRCEKPIPYTYELSEEGHHFHMEDDGKFYRISKIYRNTISKKTGKLVDKKLVRDNHSEVMYDYDLIPEELIR